MATKREIMMGIMKEHRLDLNRLWAGEDPAVQKMVIEERQNALETFFRVSGWCQGKVDDPIESKILSGQPYHPIVMTLLYIFSMETFLPSVMNEANRAQDLSKIDSIGPFAKALMMIVAYSNCWRGDALIGELSLWRGLQLTKADIEDYR